MVEHEQVRPLAPVTDRTSSDDEESALLLKKLRRRKCMKCCGCITAVLLVPAIVIVILIFTLFRVKNPSIRLNRVIITHLELINNTIPKPGTNMSLIADVSVKNPNIASFKYSNTTSALYYHGELVGEARGPPGRAKARRTLRMNVTVDIITDNLLSNPNLNTEAGTGLLTMDSYSKIPGRVKLLNIIKKHITVKMNCTITVNISSQAIQAQKCRKKVDL
ncbi:late embryogenesis abundant protein At1g64065-like [Hevea brasiliensis]|uniref:late embryogenesis abundant protein At1g64065-like n=1 Tax=Hevea brasiliensis TaxID=3981 RepID=UPI000B784D5C|nr:late embryogenesis abundant protein At1g64065-like [Hevea brasiliensis]